MRWTTVVWAHKQDWWVNIRFLRSGLSYFGCSLLLLVFQQLLHSGPKFFLNFIILYWKFVEKHWLNFALNYGLDLHKLNEQTSASVQGINMHHDLFLPLNHPTIWPSIYPSIHPSHAELRRGVYLHQSLGERRGKTWARHLSIRETGRPRTNKYTCTSLTVMLWRNNPSKSKRKSYNFWTLLLN